MSSTLILEAHVKDKSLIRHVAFMDVAIRLYNNPWIVDGSKVAFQGMWYNLGYVNTMCTNIPINLEIPFEAILRGDWELLESAEFEAESFWGKSSKCYRDGPWSKIKLIAGPPKIN